MRYVRRLVGSYLAVMLIASCAVVPSGEETAVATAPALERGALEPVPPPEGSTSDRITPERAAPATLPTVPPAAAPAPISMPRTAVVLSADIAEYTQIVAEIRRRAVPNVTVHELSGQSSNAPRVLAELAAARPDRIVAVGLLAALVARGVPDTPLVFCQVYNYQDHDLVSATSKGVDLLPPVELQLRAWRELTRNLRHVGVITGPGHDALLAQMSRAAASFGIVLTTRTVRSDREALHEFREIAPYVDGFWLLPDNRILSPDVVGEIFAYSAKRAKQIVASGDGFLKMGALLSATAEPRDVVDRVLARLDAVAGDGRLLGPDMLALTAIRTHVNEEVARRTAAQPEGTSFR